MPDAYKAEYCGTVSTWWYVLKSLVDTFPKDNIVRVYDTGEVWRCSTVDRSQVYQDIDSEDIRPVMDAGVQSCAECSDG